MPYLISLVTAEETIEIGSTTVAPDYRQAGIWCNEFVPGAPQFEKSYYDQSGVNSKGIKRYGFRQARHKLIGTIVNDSIGSVQETFQHICDIIADTSIDVEADIDNGGRTYVRCELESSESYCGTPVPNEAGFFYAAFNLTFIQIGKVSLIS